MTVREALREGTLRLAEVGTPGLDAALLLAESLGLEGREQLYARLPDAVGGDALARYRGYLARRLQGVPVSYIRGRKEFRSLLFHVGPAVMVPRPESELLVERAVERAGPRARVHDVCTGSGAVAVSLSHERPDLEVSASDISAEVEAVFAANSRRLLGREIPFHRSDLLASVPGFFDLVTANPPYLTDERVHEMSAAGWPEPVVALAGGPDGLDVARRLACEAAGRLVAGGTLLLEADPQQMDCLERHLRGCGFAEVSRWRDLSGLERVIEARRPG